MIKVSVIIPVFNMEKYLSECLDSILHQTLGKEIELVCINDGSTDGSLYILRQYEEKHSNIVIYNQLNSGVSTARNNGIKLASGEFVAFMDPDDYYLEEDCLEAMYNAATSNHVLICGGSFSEDHGTWIRKEWPGIYEKYTFTEDRLMKYNEYQFDYGYHRFLYNRKMLLDNEIMFPPYVRFQDPPFFVKAMITADQFYAMRKVSYCYRYGHQKLNWDEKRVSHVLMGFIDDLQMSRENNLNELHLLTVWRLTQEYKEPILLNRNSEIVLMLLSQARSQIDSSLPEISKFLEEGIYSVIDETDN